VDFWILFCLFAALGMEPGALHILGRCFATESHSSLPVRLVSMMEAVVPLPQCPLIGISHCWPSDVWPMSVGEDGLFSFHTHALWF
jgi:hypothetical protein